MTDSTAAVLERSAAVLLKLRGIIESSSEAMAACDLQGRVETWNAGATAVFGRDADHMIGHGLVELFPAEYLEVFGCLLREAADGRRSEIFRTVGLHALGRLVDLSVTLAPMRDDKGAVTGVAMVARDISARRRAEERAERDRRELEQREAALRDALAALRVSHEELKATQLQLMRAAKLESVGRLAAGVAHEVKNPLQIILAGTDFLISQPTIDGEQGKAVLQDIRVAVDRASGVIASLLSYSSASEVTPTAADVNDVIEQALTLVRYPLERGQVRVTRALAHDLPRIALDTVKIEQVFINLLMNAADAMPKGGTITVRTLRRQLTAGEVGVGRRHTDGGPKIGQTAVLVEIEDSGTGIPDEHLARVFDPFFTTKPAGKGTGLGLAVSKTIVTMHGGTIWMKNRPEGGTTATVVLCGIVA